MIAGKRLAYVCVLRFVDAARAKAVMTLCVRESKHKEKMTQTCGQHCCRFFSVTGASCTRPT